ncbi:MAG: blaB1 [Nitrososphaeraceae archaeon]|nr:blaB1 [Nitrososphaeraceae archaeon]MCD6036599.1 blaB1 [Nitrososphaeraceae archaeon]MDF2769301.1 blaB1 [Nitrososphaeraceae archaeon]
MHKIRYAKSLGLMILLTISLAVLPTLLLDGLTSVKTGTTPELFFEYVYGEQEESVEEAYLKFVSEIQQQQSGDSISNVTNTTTMTQIPETAKGPTIPSEKGYLVQEIGEELYSVSDGSYNTMFMVTDEGVIAIDAPPTLGANYLKAIAEVTDKPITHVIYSHAHLDHIGSAGVFPDNATFIAQQETANELQRAMSVTANTSMVPPVPTVTFPENMTLQLGNQTLQLDYHGINHLPGNIFIYAPKQKVLMLVDVIFPGWIPFAYLAIAKDTAGFIQAHDIALNNYDFDTIVAGHLTRLGTREDVEVQREFVSDLEKAAANANQNVSFSDIANQIGSFDNPWLIFSTYIDTINKQCEDEMLPKWQSRLGAAEIFMSTHCFTMTEFGRVDPTTQALLQSVS